MKRKGITLLSVLWILSQDQEAPLLCASEDSSMFQCVWQSSVVTWVRKWRLEPQVL